MQKSVTLDYTNWKGERRERVVLPLQLYWGASEYHPAPQWLLLAWDIEKEARRTFAMADIHSWQ